jgi:hypothetical protein
MGWFLLLLKMGDGPRALHQGLDSVNVFSEPLDNKGSVKIQAKCRKNTDSK